MRYAGVALLVVAMVFAFTSTAQAAPATRVAGQLTKIDGKALTITTTVDGKAVDTVVNVTDATKIRQEAVGAKGTDAQFSDLKVGQQVRSYYTAPGNVATIVVIVPAPAAGATK